MLQGQQLPNQEAVELRQERAVSDVQDGGEGVLWHCSLCVHNHRGSDFFLQRGSLRYRRPGNSQLSVFRRSSGCVGVSFAATVFSCALLSLDRPEGPGNPLQPKKPTSSPRLLKFFCGCLQAHLCHGQLCECRLSQTFQVVQAVPLIWYTAVVDSMVNASMMTVPDSMMLV